jgi:hypothetical protein
VLPTQAQRLTAGRQNLDARTGRQQVGDEARGRQHVLEVVDDEQALGSSEDAEQHLCSLAFIGYANAARFRHR